MDAIRRDLDEVADPWSLFGGPTLWAERETVLPKAWHAAIEDVARQLDIDEWASVAFAMRDAVHPTRPHYHLDEAALNEGWLPPHRGPVTDDQSHSP